MFPYSINLFPFLGTSDMESLPENVLIKIVEYLDLKNKLNFMLVCKTFYNLVATNPSLCHNFHLMLRDSHYPAELRNCSRFFSSIVFSKFHFDKENFAVILELFANIGSHLKKIQFYYGSIHRHMLYQLFRLTPNAEKIFITFLKMQSFEEDTENYKAIGHKFSKLNELFLDCGFGSIFTHLFQDAENVSDLTIYHSYEILCNKTKLKKLRIGSNDQIDFNMILDNVFQLTELRTDNFHINPGTSFENFKSMIKSQNSIQVFGFGYSDEPINEFSEILVHILNLESLEKFETGITDVFKYLPSESIRNPCVQSLRLDRGMYYETSIVQHYLKLFPCLKILQIHPYSLMNANLLLINNLSELEELHICSMIDGHVPKSTLESLKIEKLRKFHWSGYPLENYLPENFERFAQNNNGINELYLNLGYWPGVEVIEAIVKNLPCLKSFVIAGLNTSIFSLEDRLFELIGDNCKVLEYLELDIGHMKDFEEFLYKAADYWFQRLPDLKCKFYSNDIDY